VGSGWDVGVVVGVDVGATVAAGVALLAMTAAEGEAAGLMTDGWGDGVLVARTTERRVGCGSAMGVEVGVQPDTLKRDSITEASMWIRALRLGACGAKHDAPTRAEGLCAVKRGSGWYTS
jgi:hypothetical protein